MNILSRAAKAASVGTRRSAIVRRYAASLAILAGAILAGCSAKPDDALLVSKDCWVDTINGKADNLVQVERGPLEISGWFREWWPTGSDVGRT